MISTITSQSHSNLIAIMLKAASGMKPYGDFFTAVNFEPLRMKERVQDY